MVDFIPIDPFEACTGFFEVDEWIIQRENYNNRKLFRKEKSEVI